MKRTDWRRDYAAQLEDLIGQYGWAVQVVGADERAGVPTFAYTIGLERLALPEFIVFGLPGHVAQPILNDLAARARDGAAITHGTVLDDVLETYDVALLRVDDTGEHLNWASEMRSNKDQPVRAWQLIYPDAAGAWPWTAGHTAPHQPLLGQVPAELTDTNALPR